MAHEHVGTDVLVVGSGPVGATFARTLTEGGRTVLMVDAGPRLTARPGEHLRNTVPDQRDHEYFGALVRGHLHPLSDPGDGPATPDPVIGLGPGLATYAVGGMATHWTGVTPRHHPDVELSAALPAAEWESLYAAAEALLGTRHDLAADGVAHRAVRDALAAEYPELPDGYGVRHLPLAGRPRTDIPGRVHWTGADTVLGPLAGGDRSGFTLRERHLCRRLVPAPGGSRIDHAEIEDRAGGRTLHVEADVYVVACGAVRTPQLLYASGIRPPALGRYLTEQPVAFGRVVLPEGTGPFPADDPDPQVWIPVSSDRPWHCQIHRDLPYDDMPPTRYADPRRVVDLRWFGLVDPRPDNRVRFSDTARDVFGMPGPSFLFGPGDDDRARAHRMIADLRRAASALGPYLPGAEPRFVVPTPPLHVTGTTRMGTDPATSVVDAGSRVHGVHNLHLGGNGLIPTGTASNPTLTAVATALRAARGLLDPERQPTTERHADERPGIPVPR